MKIKNIVACQKVEKPDSLVIEVTLLNGIQGSSTISISSLQDNNAIVEIKKIIEIVNHTISPFFEGKVCDMVECDNNLEEIYKSEDTPLVPLKIINIISIAISNAQAAAEKIELFELFADIAENETVAIPYPFFQISDEHSFEPDFPIQRLFLLPLGASSFRHSLTSFGTIKTLLSKYSYKKSSTSVEDILCNLNQLLEKAELQDVFVLGIEGNANVLYNSSTGSYSWLAKSQTGEQLFSFYKNIIENNNVFSIQNGFAQEDILGARTLLDLFGDRVQLISNESLSFNDMPGLEKLKTYANACIVQLESYLTITHALVHVKQLRSEGINVIIAPTVQDNASFMVDFAVGTSAGQIKTFNHLPALTDILFERLLDVEDTMTFSLLSLG